jgi:hypothetical protein
MIGAVDDRLKAWVEAVLTGVDVSLAPPDDSQTGRVANLYLMALADRPPLRSMKRPPLQLALDYLVTTGADTFQEAHRMLGELVFAAMENPEFQVDLEPPPTGTWAALGVKPRPAFILRVPVQRERPLPPATLVKEPLVVHAEPVISIEGQVLGPEELPVYGARVALPQLDVATRTDAQGRFRFGAVPAGATRVHVRAKGKELERTVRLPPVDGEPLVLRFESFEPGEPRETNDSID